ncbi:putative cyclin-dependent kinase F-2 [Phragmites australis]|uniref:putative cyclin-dependent kinase F-2 n=1 Tax=Phragmites australis TaxID=29695 RepID=UPI002D77FEB2|nr:putative cyclin-dependent kinase F-2 [Phragmites australis]
MFLKVCQGRPSVFELRRTFADHSNSEGDSVIVMERRCAGSCANSSPVSGDGRSQEAGILHRDIKPENVLIDHGVEDRTQNPLDKEKGAPAVDDKQQPPKEICDFAMSEPVTRKEAEYLPLATWRPYRTPEIFLGSKDYDGRIDTKALGCIMAELLAGGDGRAFFDTKTDADVLRKMLDVVGAQGIKDWHGLFRLAMRDPETAQRVRDCRDTGRLREVFLKEVLSKAGFKCSAGCWTATRNVGSPRRTRMCSRCRGSSTADSLYCNG